MTLSSLKQRDKKGPSKCPSTLDDEIQMVEAYSSEGKNSSFRSPKFVTKGDEI